MTGALIRQSHRWLSAASAWIVPDDRVREESGCGVAWDRAENTNDSGLRFAVLRGIQCRPAVSAEWLS